MQIRQAVNVRLMNKHGVRIGNIQATFDDGRGQQNVGLPCHEFHHRLLQQILMHLPMCDGDAGFRNNSLQTLSQFFNIVHSIVHKINLPSAIQFPNNRTANERFIKTTNPRFNRHSITRRRRQAADVTNSQQGHMQSSGNRCCCQCQDIHLSSQCLQSLLHLHAELLLLIDDKQPEIRELDIFGNKAMSPDQNVNLSLLQLFQDLRLLCIRSKTGQHFDGDRKLRHPLTERAIVLLGQYSCRYQHSNLTPVINRLEYRPHGNFRLAKADITADQAVHWPRVFHVAFQIRNSGHLIGRFGVGERFFKFLLQMTVRTTLQAGTRGSLGLQLEHIRGHVGNRLGHLLFLPQPRRSAVFRQLRCCLCRPDILLHQMNQRNRHVNRHAVAKFKEQMLLLRSFSTHHRDAAVPSNPVSDMDHEISVSQIQKAVNRPRIILTPTRCAAHRRPRKQFTVADHHQPMSRDSKALPKPPGHHMNASC